MRSKIKHGCYLILGILSIVTILTALPLQGAQGAVKLTTKKVNLQKGDKYTLKITGTKQRATWYTSKAKVATVRGGIVTAKNAGSAYITAKIGQKKYVCKVTVHNCKINTTHVIMTKGKTFLLKITGSIKKPTYKSNNTSIATVDKNTGKITAKKTGTTEIIVTAGSKKFHVSVQIESPKLNKTSLTWNCNLNFSLKLSTKRAVKWSSSDPSVATVNSNGKITTISSGKTTIWAKISDKTFSCKVNVRTPTIVNWPSTITVGLGKAIKYSLIVGDGFSITSKEDYITKKLTPQNYAAGDQLTVTFTGDSVGSELITLKDTNGLKKDIKVQVTGTVLPASCDYKTINHTSINSVQVYRGTGSLPWINIKGTVTYRSAKKLDSLYIAYNFYNKSNQIIKSFYYPIDTPMKDKTYAFNHSFNGSSEKWTSQVSYTKVTYVDGILPANLANSTLTDSLVTEVSNSFTDLSFTEESFKLSYSGNHAFQYNIHYFFHTQYSGTEASRFYYYFEFYDKNGQLIEQTKDYVKEVFYDKGQSKSITGTLNNVVGSVADGEIASVKMIIRQTPSF